jgi:hypothetical protein
LKGIIVQVVEAVKIAEAVNQSKEEYRSRNVSGCASSASPWREAMQDRIITEGGKNQSLRDQRLFPKPLLTGGRLG